MDALQERLDQIVLRQKKQLQKAIERRLAELSQDSQEHFMLYRMLGLPEAECPKVDLYQNVGRFLFNYAGSLIEELTQAVMAQARGGERVRIPNTVSASPRQFEIDWLVSSDQRAHEIKWRDATTDGDHVRKEMDKVRCIVASGLVPVRVMYFWPNREQAQRIQTRITELYRQHGEAHIGQDAWAYIHTYTGFDLRGYLAQKAEEKTAQALWATPPGA